MTVISPLLPTPDSQDSSKFLNMQCSFSEFLLALLVKQRRATGSFLSVNNNNKKIASCKEQSVIFHPVCFPRYAQL